MSSHTTSASKAIFYALGANGGIAMAKFAAALFTGSGAMLAEAIHSLADCTNQIFLLIGLKESKKLPDDAHPMGYGRVVYFWAMMVALLLFFLGGAYTVMEGLAHLKHPEPIHNPFIAITVLGVSVVLEAFSLYGAMQEIKKISQGRPFFQWFRETRQSELLVIAGEDIAALLGLAIALMAVVLATVTGNPIWDVIGSIMVGLLLITIAVFIMREVKAMITGESAEPALREAIKAHIEARPEVEKIIHLITLQWGEQLMVAVQAKMHTQVSDRALVDAINAVEESIQSTWPQVKWCFFEPDVEGTKD